MSDWDVDPLEEPLPLLHHEMGLGLLGRHAAFNGYGNTREFASHMLLSFNRIASGEREELRRLAHLTRADLTELLAHSPVTIKGARFTINGEVITTGRSRRTRIRCCPACVAADRARSPHLPPDAAVAWRVETIIEPVRTCPEHDMSYVQIAEQGSLGYQTQDYTIAISDALEDADWLFAQSVRRAVTAFELYVLGRLGLAKRVFVQLLDALSITDVTKICERMGIFALHGRKAQLERLDEDRRWAAAQAGFDYLELGPDGVRAFVNRAHEQATVEQRRGLSNTIFGRFHYFLNSEAALDSFIEIKQLIADELAELLPYGPDDGPLFGVNFTKRRWHTLISAERQYGIPYRTIQSMARDAGIAERLNANFAKTRHLIDAHALHGVLTGGNAELRRSRVIRRTGLDAKDFTAVCAAGLLVPLRGKPDAAAAIFRRSDVDRLEETLLAHARPIQGEVEGMVSVAAAFLRTAWTRAEVFKHVADGKVRTASVTGLRPIASLRVSLEDLVALHPLNGQPTVSIDEAAASLRISSTVVSQLVRGEMIIGHHLRNRDTGKLRVHIPLAEVEAFRTRYISFHEVWLRSGGSMAGLSKWLIEAGHEPVDLKGEYRVTLYLREQVEPLL